MENICMAYCYAECLPPFDLSPVEFQDALSLRYHWPLLKTPAHCDGCGEEYMLLIVKWWPCYPAP